MKVKKTRLMEAPDAEVVDGEVVEPGTAQRAGALMPSERKDYAAEFSKAKSVEREEAVVKRFIRQWSLDKNIDSNVKRISEPLTREMLSLREKAFDPLTNPVLTFLENYLSTSQMTPDQFIVLNNMWSDGTIGRQELLLKTPDECILQNSYLWKKPLNDIPFIVKTYLWLSDISNIKRYVNLKTLAKGLSAYMASNGKTSSMLTTLNVNFTTGEGGKLPEIPETKATAEYIRDVVVFVDSKNPSGDVNEAKTIEENLTILSELSPTGISDEDILKAQANQEDVTVEEIQGMFKSGNMTKKDFLKIYKFAQMQGWLK